MAWACMAAFKALESLIAMFPITGLLSFLERCAVHDQNGLGLRNFLEQHGCEYITTDKKCGPGNGAWLACGNVAMCTCVM